MNIVRWLSVAVLSAVVISCGDDEAVGCSDSDATGTASFALSDAPVDDLKSVTVEIDTITLVRSGDDVVINTFTSEDLDIIEADTFQIDLLEYRGSDQAIVIEELELPAGEYTDLRLEILDGGADGDINQSFVTELNDERKPIKLPSDELRLGGFTVEEGGVQVFTIEFDLRQALTYNPTPDRYILKPRGVHILDNATASSLTGQVDSALFNTVSPCDDKEGPQTGNVVYLYEGHELEPADLADVYDPDVDSGAPQGAIAPYAAKAPVETGVDDWEYNFGFLPAGEYTLVFSCAAADDEPESYDGINLPLPEEQLIELTLGAGTGTVCNLPVSNGACSR